MRAITLTQPWATLMASGAKKIETRSWLPRGLRNGETVAIHAAKGFADMSALEFCELCVSEPFKSALRDAYVRGVIQKHDGRERLVPADLPRGAVVAIATFVKCRPTEEVRPFLSEPERSFGNYASGRYAWFFRDAEPVGPFLARGALGLWEWNPDPALLADREEAAPPANRPQRAEAAERSIRELQDAMMTLWDAVASQQP